jgi:hypothetical protein
MTVILFDNGFIETCSFTEFILLHKDDVSYIELPDVNVVTKFNRLPKYLLHLRIVFLFPEDLGLGHQDWDVFATRKR